MDMSSDISTLNGVGTKIEEKLNSCGIYSILDLILYFPRDYEEFSMHSEISGINKDEKVTLKLKVLKFLNDIRTRNGKIISTVVFTDGKNTIKGRWFNQPYYKNKFKPNFSYNITGKVQIYNNEAIIMNPSVSQYNVYDSESKPESDNSYEKIEECSLFPKYSLKAGVTDTLIKKLIKQVLGSIVIIDNLPDYLVKKYKLCSLDTAVRNIHRPMELKKLQRSSEKIEVSGAVYLFYEDSYA